MTTMIRSGQDIVIVAIIAMIMIDIPIDELRQHRQDDLSSSHHL